METDGRLLFNGLFFCAFLENYLRVIPYRPTAVLGHGEVTVREIPLSAWRQKVLGNRGEQKGAYRPPPRLLQQLGTAISELIELRIDVQEGFVDLLGPWDRPPSLHCSDWLADFRAEIPLDLNYIAEQFELEAYRHSSDPDTYLFNVFLIAARLLRPELVRAQETGFPVDTSSGARVAFWDAKGVLRFSPNTLDPSRRDRGGFDHRNWKDCPRAVAAAKDHHVRILRSLEFLQRSNLRHRLRQKATDTTSFFPGSYLSSAGCTGRDLAPLPTWGIDWLATPFLPYTFSGRPEGVALAEVSARKLFKGPLHLITFLPPHLLRPQYSAGDSVVNPLRRWHEQLQQILSPLRVRQSYQPPPPYRWPERPPIESPVHQAKFQRLTSKDDRQPTDVDSPLFIRRRFLNLVRPQSYLVRTRRILARKPIHRPSEKEEPAYLPGDIIDKILDFECHPLQRYPHSRRPGF